MDRNKKPYKCVIFVIGQARKSLWIETESIYQTRSRHGGQARKSLWIETFSEVPFLSPTGVRLVRACGSKPLASAVDATAAFGQARKSLWIETIQM